MKKPIYFSSNRYLSFLFLGLIYGSLISAQQNENEYVRSYITTEQGLSHNYVTSIASDNLNNKWIATENGITKYNGYYFEYIKPSLGYNQLNNENIEVLFKDGSGNIWIGTKSGGLSYLDVKQNKIKNYNHLIDTVNEGDVRITTLSESNSGEIWVGTWGQGVYVINTLLDSVIHHFPDTTPIYKITKGVNDDMWYIRGQTLVHYNGVEIKNRPLSSLLSDVLYDPFRNKVWVSSGKGNTKLFYYDYENQSIDSLETNIKSNFTKTLSLDDQHQMWVGTWGYGLYKSDTRLTKFEKVAILPFGSERIKRNYDVILDIHHDKNKQIWIGTANAGVIQLIPQKGFNNLSNIIKEDKLEGDFNITAIYKDTLGFYLGTLKSGFFIGDNHSDLEPLETITRGKIFALYAHQDKLFIGTNDGFSIYDLKRRKVVFKSDDLNKVTSFFVDHNQNLYLGTQQKGLFVVPLNDIENFKRYVRYSDTFKGDLKIESNRITGIKEDEMGNIWVGTYNGIHLYEKIKKTFIHQSQLLDETLPSIIINAIEVKNNKIWVATPSGLVGLKYDSEAKKLRVENKLTIKDGLSNDFISSLTFGKNGDLWMTTNTGIVKYNTNEKSFLAYGKLEGVNTTSFNNRSVFNYKNETLYFGGIDNLTFFDPNTISSSSNLSKVIFSTLRINNQKIDFKKDLGIIDQTFSYTEKINLKWNDKFFAIGLSTNDFLGKLNVKYRYKIKGYQDEWINIQNKNEINFASLQPGSYTLMVAATRDNQNWSEPSSIMISVASAPWFSVWAFILYLFIIAVGTYLFLRFKKKQLQLKTDLEIVQIEKEKEYALNEAKLNFFTNISHEFRTPLTLMTGPIKELATLTELDEKAQKKISTIERNSDKLLNLINQLLDFRKADKGVLKLNASQGNFARFSEEVFLYFTEFAQERKIKYKFNCSVKEIRFPFDRNKMEVVLCNLISNAFKHCKSGDTVIFSLKQIENTCEITIKDTGLGIEPKYLDKIFDQFFQIKSSNTSKMVGSGIGLAFTKKIVELHHGKISVESKKNVGSNFVIVLNMDEKLYQDSIDENFVNTDNMKAYETIKKEEYNSDLSLNPKENSILIIDDNPDILDYLKDVLDKDFQVISASGGITGHELALKHIPDIIVSDVMMPDKDGITLCKELKSHIDTSHIPIILLTARTSTVFEIEGLKTGADDYITKPFNPLVVKARLTSILENRSKLREHFAHKVRFEPTVTDANPKEDAENAFIQKAMQLVEGNLQNSSFGIENMMDYLNMSQSTLYRKIKSLTGLSLSGFIRSVRIKKSAFLILTTEMNLNEIAYDVGFNDYKYFNSCFKKQFECLPSQYREKYEDV